MIGRKTATLTGSLLVVKGAASPNAAVENDGGRATIQSLRARPMRAPYAQKNDGYSHLSLRMNSVRHLRLRLAAAHLGYSGNALVIAALDHYLDHVLPSLLEGNCGCLEKGRGQNQGCAAAALANLPADLVS